MIYYSDIKNGQPTLPRPVPSIVTVGTIVLSNPTEQHLVDHGWFGVDRMPADPLPTLSSGYKHGIPAVANRRVVVAAIAKTTAEIAADTVTNIDSLWRAASAVESNKISGVGVGLLTMGVMQKGPVAMAIQGWVTALWDEYYVRRALVAAGATPDLDFSAYSTPPNGIPELRTELGM